MRETGRSINDFIEHKRNVEHERPVLTADPRLITIDGIDGAGKTTFSRIFADRLTERHGADDVALVTLGNFKGGPNQERIGDLMRRGDLTAAQIDGLFAAVVNRAYDEEIGPALDGGNHVVVDRSEIDLLRFAMEFGSDKDIERRLAYLKDGTLTHRRWAGHRIFMRTPATDAWNNLETRPNRSKYDPKSVDDVMRRIEAERLTEARVVELPHQGDVIVHEFDNHRIENDAERDQWLRAQADRIIDDLSTA